MTLVTCIVLYFTDSGTMYTFGSDYSGCLGCNQEEGDEVDTPLEVTFFHGKPVERVSCGEKHILALTADKEVYSWGCGDKGWYCVSNCYSFIVTEMKYVMEVTELNR